MNRYTNYTTPKVVENTKYVPGLVRKESNYTGPEVFHIVKSNEVDRLDLISYTYYNNPLYWWVIAVHNKIKNPRSEYQAGEILKIPMDLSIFFSEYLNV